MTARTVGGMDYEKEARAWLRPRFLAEGYGWSEHDAALAALLRRVAAAERAAIVALIDGSHPEIDYVFDGEDSLPVVDWRTSIESLIAAIRTRGEAVE